MKRQEWVSRDEDEYMECSLCGKAIHESEFIHQMTAFHSICLHVKCVARNAQYVEEPVSLHYSEGTVLYDKNSIPEVLKEYIDEVDDDDAE